MKVGDFVRYASTGDALGTGIVLELQSEVLGPDPRVSAREALVMWNGEHRGMPIRWIYVEYLELICSFL
jgi:hypothetical protein